MPEAGEVATSDTKQLGMVWIMGCRCRCGHEWVPHTAERPHVCPSCKSPRWDKKKKFERKKKTVPLG
ncbi:hypothetical protein KIH39_11970 [Telmatocola sphagniphila]|uniref:Uncharacterized protein n=1 Tax=Telmatocola sphagniphila TaxID=1123043 RepID=A0A8E6BA31_9BACT|nr:hypothetical protein [Telmatocola sphagniphila]QVL34588.1 hypothetical protein KIH39_11970 [Telmatocola sphagniphila]